MEHQLVEYSKNYLDFLFNRLSKDWEDMIARQNKRLNELNDSIMRHYNSLESSSSHLNKTSII